MLHCAETLLCSASGCLQQHQPQPHPQQQPQPPQKSQQKHLQSFSSVHHHHQQQQQQHQQHNASTQQQQQLQMTNIENPAKNDVLCGRGVALNNWKGNVQFRAIVSLHKATYITSSKRQKMAISRAIVAQVRAMVDPQPGRFLEKDIDTGLWSDVGDKKAIEKTSQALRDGAALLRKQLMSTTSPTQTTKTSTNELDDHPDDEDDDGGDDEMEGVKAAVETKKDVIEMVPSRKLQSPMSDEEVKPIRRTLSDSDNDNDNGAFANQKHSVSKKRTSTSTSTTTSIVENTAVVASHDAVEGILMSYTPPRLLSSSSFSKPVSPASASEMYPNNEGVRRHSTSSCHHHHTNNHRNANNNHQYYWHHPVISPSIYPTSPPTHDNTGSSSNNKRSVEHCSGTIVSSHPHESQPLPPPPPPHFHRDIRSYGGGEGYYEVERQYHYQHQHDHYDAYSTSFSTRYNDHYHHYDESKTENSRNSTARKRNYSRRSVSFECGRPNPNNEVVRSESFDEVHNRHRRHPPITHHDQPQYPPQHQHHHYQHHPSDRSGHPPPSYHSGGGNHHDPYYYSTYEQRHHPLLSPNRGVPSATPSLPPVGETSTSSPWSVPYPVHPPVPSCTSFPPPPPAVVRSSKEAGPSGFHPDVATSIPRKPPAPEPLSSTSSAMSRRHPDSGYPPPLPPPQQQTQQWPPSSYHTAPDGQLYIPTLKHRYPLPPPPPPPVREFEQNKDYNPDHHRAADRCYSNGTTMTSSKLEQTTSFQDFTPPITPDPSSERMKTPLREQKIIVPRAIVKEENDNANIAGDDNPATTNNNNNNNKISIKVSSPEKKTKRAPPALAHEKDKTIVEKSDTNKFMNINDTVKRPSMSSDTPASGSTVASSCSGSVCSSTTGGGDGGRDRHHHTIHNNIHSTVGGGGGGSCDDGVMMMVLDRQHSREEKKEEIEDVDHDDLPLPTWNNDSDNTVDDDIANGGVVAADNEMNVHDVDLDSTGNYIREDDDDDYSCSPLPFYNDEANERLMEISDDMINDIPLIPTRSSPQSSSSKSSTNINLKMIHNNNKNHNNKDNNNATSDEEMSYN